MSTSPGRRGVGHLHQNGPQYRCRSDFSHNGSLRASTISAQLERLYREAKADRWRLPRVAFANALENSCRKAFPGDDPSSRELSRYLSSLHLEDLALACACAEGHAAAWDHFVLEMRPALYRSADALDPSGGARDLADSLYGELYGVNERGGAGQSLLRYFHGRSSLATWLRAVLAQRYIDRLRSAQRIEPLPDELPQRAADSRGPDPDCPRLVDLLRRCARGRRGASRAARSAAAGVLLRRAVDAGADRTPAQGARGDGVAAACPHAEGHPGRCRARSARAGNDRLAAAALL